MSVVSVHTIVLSRGSGKMHQKMSWYGHAIFYFIYFDVHLVLANDSDIHDHDRCRRNKVPKSRRLPFLGLSRPFLFRSRFRARAYIVIILKRLNTSTITYPLRCLRAAFRLAAPKRALSSMASTSAPLPSESHVTVPEGFTLHRENTTSILLPSNNEAFLNPVQEFNRDLSVACIRVWSEELNALRERRWHDRMSKLVAGRKKAKLKNSQPSNGDEGASGTAEEKTIPGAQL